MILRGSSLQSSALLIRVETRSGVVGYGPGPATAAAKSAIDDVIAPFLIGRLLAEPDALRIQFQHRFGARQGELRTLYCAVELALYDALGKALSVPVSELAGGRVRDRIKLFHPAGVQEDEAGFAAEVAEAAGRGLLGCELHPALLNAGTLEAIGRARPAGHDDMDIMVDARCPEAILESTAEKLATQHVAWLKDPLPADDVEGYRKLHGLNLVPVARTVEEGRGMGFHALAASEAVDYAVMDLFGQGGGPGFRRVAPDIGDTGVRVVFGHGGSVFELLAAAHLGICWPETAVEWAQCASPLADGLIRESLVIDQGDLVVSPSPGFGVTVDEDRIADLRRQQ